MYSHLVYVHSPSTLIGTHTHLLIYSVIQSGNNVTELTALHLQLLTGWPKNKKNVAPELASYFHVRDELAVQDNLVYRGSYRVVVPISMLGALINLAPQGHQGIVRTKQCLRDLYWWPGMDHSVQSSISSCHLFQSHNKSAKTHLPPRCRYQSRLHHGRRLD